MLLHWPVQDYDANMIPCSCGFQRVLVVQIHANFLSTDVYVK